MHTKPIKQCLLNRYENSKLEQYQHKGQESEDVLEAKVVELASDMGVTLHSSDISEVHRIGGITKQGKTRPVSVRFCQRKKINKILKKNSELEKKT